MILALALGLSVPICAPRLPAGDGVAATALRAFFDGSPLAPGAVAFPQISSLGGYRKSLSADFPWRDSLPQTEIPRDQWESCCGHWGPHALPYPPAQAPDADDGVSWLRDRVVAVALKYVGLPYLHRHIPAMGGLDCSNFTAWVYNYGFGIRLNSNVQRQAETAGRRLGPDEPLRPGDLIFLWNDERSRVSHVAIYVDESTIIDAAAGGVAVRPFSDRHRARLAWTRRVF